MQRKHKSSTDDRRENSRIRANKIQLHRKRVVLDSARAIMEALDTPKSLAVEIILRSGDHGALRHLSWDPLDYTETMWQKARDDLQAVSLLKKTTFLNVGVDTQLAALDKWVEAERGCATANDRLRSLWFAHNQDDIPFKATLLKARSFIERILGKAPRWSDLPCRHGPGATALRKRWITPSQKFGSERCLTPGLLPYFLDSRCGLSPIGWESSSLLVVDGNTLSFVLKNYLTKRPIGTEPDENVWVQLGVGAEMRSRFRRYIDLDRQAEVNSQFAKFAYADGFSTIDLSSASDTVCQALVNILFPEDWLELMDACRSAYTTFEGRTVKLEKYSSMGNGFTFEMESIIFYALAVASGAETCLTCVFGDDIIVHRSYASKVINTLEMCGFKVNKQKTFVDGLFFESCGHDYFCGRNIRPVIWKDGEDPDARSSDVDEGDITIANINNMANGISLLAAARLRGEMSHSIDGTPRCRSFRKAFDVLVNLLKQERHYYKVPAGFEDAGIVSSFDDAVPTGLGQGWCGFSFKALKYVSLKRVEWDRREAVTHALASRQRSNPLSSTYPIFPSHQVLANLAVKLGPPAQQFPSCGVAVRGEGRWRRRVLKVFGPWNGTGAWI